MKKVVIIVLALLLIITICLYLIGHKSQSQIEREAFLKAEVLMGNNVNNLFSEISANYIDYLSYKKSENDFMKGINNHISSYKKIEEESQKVETALSISKRADTNEQKAAVSINNAKGAIGELLYKSVDEKGNPITRDKLFELLYKSKKEIETSLTEFKNYVKVLSQ